MYSGKGALARKQRQQRVSANCHRPEQYVQLPGASPVRPELRRGPMNGFKKILFPTDFSANADKALAHAIRLAEFDKGEVIVQHVVGNHFEKNSHWATLFD